MTTKEVARLVSSMATKLCKLDAILTSVLKQITPSIIEIITKIINISFAQDTFVEEWKTAIVCPLLKKLGSELIPSNYRSVSNLSFLITIIGKVHTMTFLTITMTPISCYLTINQPIERIIVWKYP